MPSPTEELLARLLDGVERELDSAVALRAQLAETPELAHAELRTAATVADAMPVTCEPAAGTGLLARMGAGGAPVAVRAELDAVAVQDPGGEPGARHVCGHDVHMAALVALSRAAAAIETELPAPLLAVFQPSEEAYPSGAALLARAGLGDPGPRAVVAAHVHPELPWGALGLTDGVVNASCDAFEITIRGVPSHGAYPHRGRDPVLAIAETVVALNARAGRVLDPLHAASLSVGIIEAGTADNVIPATASASGAVRAHDERDREALRALVSEVVAGVSAAHGCTGEVVITEGEPPLANDAELIGGARDLLEVAGFAAAPAWRSCGSDDFAFFGADTPIAMAFVGLAGADGFAALPLHHPDLRVPDAAVGAVARAQAVLYAAACR